MSLSPLLSGSQILCSFYYANSLRLIFSLQRSWGISIRLGKIWNETTTDRGRLEVDPLGKARTNYFFITSKLVPDPPNLSTSRPYSGTLSPKKSDDYSYFTGKLELGRGRLKEFEETWKEKSKKNPWVGSGASLLVPAQLLCSTYEHSPISRRRKSQFELVPLLGANTLARLRKKNGFLFAPSQILCSSGVA